MKMATLNNTNSLSYGTTLVTLPVIVWNPQVIMAGDQYKNTQVSSRGCLAHFSWSNCQTKSGLLKAFHFDSWV